VPFLSISPAAVARRRSSAYGSGTSTEQAEEAFRVLRSNVLVALQDLANPIVVITSAQAGEGKTWTCAGLAVSLASIGKRIVVVDLDLRSPALHTHLGGRNDVGVTSYLQDDVPLADCLQFIDLTARGHEGRGLYLLSTGPAVSTPTELLTARRTRRLLEALAAQADVVLLDSPPVLAIADTLEIGRMAAGALLIVEARRTEVGVAQRAKDALIQNQTRLLGVVVNRVPRDEIAYGYGGPGAPTQ